MAAKAYLGVDYGHTRIGLAAGDSETKLAHPHGSIVKSQDPARDVAAAAKSQGATMVVLGLPRSLDGEETLQSGAVRLFADQIRQHGLTVHLQDEAGTTALAQERLGKKAAEADLDAEAAAIILQDYLDSL